MIEIKGLSKKFPSEHNGVEVLKNVSFTVNKTEFLCILGHSGCGKSTLLRIIAGMESPDEGSIMIDGIERTKPTADVLMIFQEFEQLFPWKTVLQNVMYPLLATKKQIKREDARRMALEIIEHVGLKEFVSHYPHQLSGGMKQRVAVARALVLRPKVLLMDEPFAALDAGTRMKLQLLTKKVCTENKITVVFVTHNVEEAVLLADRILIMNRGFHGIERIIENYERHEASGKDRIGKIADIIAMLNKQIEGDSAEVR